MIIDTSSLACIFSATPDLTPLKLWNLPSPIPFSWSHRTVLSRSLWCLLPFALLYRSFSLWLYSCIYKHPSQTLFIFPWFAVRILLRHYYTWPVWNLEHGPIYCVVRCRRELQLPSLSLSSLLSYLFSDLASNTLPSCVVISDPLLLVLT